jgi:hypothetical protein
VNGGYLDRCELEELVFDGVGHTVAVTDEKTLARLRKVLAHVGAPDDVQVVYIEMRGDRLVVSWSAQAGSVPRREPE